MATRNRLAMDELAMDELAMDERQNEDAVGAHVLPGSVIA